MTSCFIIPIRHTAIDGLVSLVEFDFNAFLQKSLSDTWFPNQQGSILILDYRRIRRNWIVSHDL